MALQQRSIPAVFKSSISLSLKNRTMKYTMAIALLILVLSFFGAITAEKVTVDTFLGSMTGVVLKSEKRDDFMAFRGIPYAKPPIKNLRFQDPVPVEAWNGTLDATEMGSNCIQLNMMNQDLEGEEDCLYLNVYVPRSIWRLEGTSTPVMVYIHGGGFASGSGDEFLSGPQRFMDQEIVLVTFNYRLGPFGFLSTNDEVSPGNYGLLDQVMVLKWVQKHISTFRGDPNSVTIFGESAGSISVSYHIISPRSSGLFHAAIHQSGNVLNEWAFDESPCKLTTKIATTLKCPVQPSTELIKCLRRRAALDIIMTVKKAIMNQKLGNRSILIYLPVIDASRGVNAFLPMKPIDQLLEGNITIVPTISGLTKDEGMLALMMLSPLFGGIGTNIHTLVSRIFPMIHPSLFRDPERGFRAIQKIVAYYLKSEDDMSLNEKLLTFIKIFNGHWRKSNDDYNEILMKRGATVFSFLFTFRGYNSLQEMFSEYANLPKGFMDAFKIVSHGDDLLYLFPCSYFKNQRLFGIDRKVSDDMLAMWTYFANHKRLPQFENWKEMAYGDPKYYKIEFISWLVNGYTNPDKKLWDEIYESG